MISLKSFRDCYTRGSPRIVYEILHHGLRKLCTRTELPSEGVWKREVINFTGTFTERYGILSAVYALPQRGNACYVDGRKKEE